MSASVRIGRDDLTAVDRLIRLRKTIDRDGGGQGLELISRAEQSGEEIELLDLDGAPLGCVTVFSSIQRRIGDQPVNEWIVRFRPQDNRAKALLDSLKAGPPEPY